jgi:ferritin-like metal-binding protein YciE
MSLIKEANETAGAIEDKAVLGAAIVANSQATEHYGISRYGPHRIEPGHDDVVRLLTTNLNEEKAANTKLNAVARHKGRQQECFRGRRTDVLPARRGSEVSERPCYVDIMAARSS